MLELEDNVKLEIFYYLGDTDIVLEDNLKKDEKLLEIAPVFVPISSIRLDYLSAFGCLNIDQLRDEPT